MSGTGEKTVEALAAEAEAASAAAAAEAAVVAEAARVAAEEAAKTPEGITAAAAAAEAEKNKLPPADKDAWKEKRLAKVAAQRDEERARTKVLEDELAALKAGNGGAASEEEIERRVAERLKVAAPEKTWNDRMNTLVTAGRDKFGVEKFNQSIQQLRTLVDPKDPAEAQQYRAFLAAVDETGEGAGLIYDLGRDPGRFQEIMEMPPLRMAVELTRLSTKLKEPEKLSGMPQPIKTVESHGIHYEEIKPDSEAGKKLPIGEWMARREKQARERGIQ